MFTADSLTPFLILPKYNLDFHEALAMSSSPPAIHITRWKERRHFYILRIEKLTFKITKFKISKLKLLKEDMSAFLM